MGSVAVIVSFITLKKRPASSLRIYYLTLKHLLQISF